jgi:hypothetical protein
MLFKTQRGELQLARNAAKDVFNNTGLKPSVVSPENLSIFGGSLGYASKLIWQEKEILFFAILQWVTIAVAYVLWTKILYWIPDAFWEEVRRSSENDDSGAFTLINIALLLWSFLVIAAASYPLSILNAAMTASHYLRSANKPSTMASCLNLAFNNLGRVWVFTTIDAWITVDAILDRLPRKGRNRSATDELLYYAWKIGTVGVLPALVAGKGYADAAKDSVSVLRSSPARAIGIRMGYSLICWIIGVTAYFGSLYYLTTVGGPKSGTNGLYQFYVIIAVPITIAVGINSVLIRPFYLVMISKLYSDVLPLDEGVTVPTAARKFDVLALIFSVMLSALLALYFFGDELGIRAWIEHLALEDIQTYRQSAPNSGQ